MEYASPRAVSGSAMRELLWADGCRWLVLADPYVGIGYTVGPGSRVMMVGLTMCFCAMAFLLPSTSNSTLASNASSEHEDEVLPDGPIIKVILREWDRRDFRESSDALANWLNARWRKSGYSLSLDTVYAVLRSNGRSAFRGLGDQSGGAFNR
ncbi:hypothetical protein K490DRAFT_58846 [Saccharata proteae CBS 121410]|uniref:Uncharacterized protein n=1 Tax=Saccharata proteae CBS 121410 TaxID=1314787 RepID=A0A9P4HRA1_9PEZI|nr:hypothetical protein K490DRAFT_58846 [Saccharata proteae CBS 121410]